MQSTVWGKCKPAESSVTNAVRSRTGFTVSSAQSAPQSGTNSKPKTRSSFSSWKDAGPMAAGGP
eukprot:6193263-Pleurochrysis_carterae.AAC.1